MPRYVLVEVDDNDKADRLVEKFAETAGFNPIGVFAKPTRFCECPPEVPVDQNARSPRMGKQGWYVHEKCKRPKKGQMQQPNNLIYDQVIPPQLKGLFLNIEEPYAPAEEKYGQATIDRLNDNAATMRVKLARWRAEGQLEKRVARRKNRKRKPENPRRGDG